jgi:hypothetical protein
MYAAQGALVEHVALLDTDSRSARFKLEHGRSVQVELDALPPDDLRALFEDALAEVWDKSIFESVRQREDAEREEL